MRNRWEFNFNYRFPVNVWGIYTCIYILEMPEMCIVYSSNIVIVQMHFALILQNVLFRKC